MLEVTQLIASYNSEKTLNFPDWKLEQGQHSLILGTSGSGKTTLLHILAGLLKPKSGKVSISGTNLFHLNSTKRDLFRGQNIGLIFQKPHLIDSLSVLDNMLMAQYFAGLAKDKLRVKQVLEELNVLDKLHVKPYTLSQGEAQRVSIARAVLNKPKVILADEPTSALDDDNCKAVLNLLVQEASVYNATLVMATHDQRAKEKIPKQLMVQVSRRTELNAL